MPISIRLDKESENILRRAVDRLHTTRSDVIRDAIKNYYSNILEERQKTPWEIYQAVHTHGGSGHGRRIHSGKAILRDALNKKRENLKYGQ